MVRLNEIVIEIRLWYLSNPCIGSFSFTVSLPLYISRTVQLSFPDYSFAISLPLSENFATFILSFCNFPFLQSWTLPPSPTPSLNLCLQLIPPFLLSFTSLFRPPSSLSPFTLFLPCYFHFYFFSSSFLSFLSYAVFFHFCPHFSHIAIHLFCSFRSSLGYNLRLAQFNMTVSSFLSPPCSGLESLSESFKV